MFLEEDSRKGGGEPRVETKTALRHLLLFQLKLAADALRDFLLSPLSVLAFLIDVIRKPPLKESLYLRLMLAGRRSDRFINLFDDHKDGGNFTIDNAVDELELAVKGSRTSSADSSAPHSGDDSARDQKSGTGV